MASSLLVRDGTILALKKPLPSETINAIEPTRSRAGCARQAGSRLIAHELDRAAVDVPVLDLKRAVDEISTALLFCAQSRFCRETKKAARDRRAALTGLKMKTG
jgi:hypothetical protein